ncbi:complex I subunit 1/NuoH family protein [Hydrogenimonas sp.]
MSTAALLVSLAVIVLAALLALLMIPVLVWLERRVCGLIQDRLGPNRTNLFGFRFGGVVQSFADVVKLVVKEEYYPAHIAKNRWLFMLAPMITFAAALLAFMVIPFADDVVVAGERFRIQALPVDYGVLWYLAIGSVGVIGMVFGGWLSHNKYSLLGAMRAASQMVSYELALGLGVVSMILTYGTIDFNAMVAWQSGTVLGVLPAWGVLVQPLAAIVVIVALFVETNRAPFSVAEGESEIVAGFFTEYSAMKFALYFMGEYVAMNTASAVIVTMFFGGYQLPWLSTEALQAHFAPVAWGIVVALPLLVWCFIGWMRRNNRLRPGARDDGSRAFETRVLTYALVAMTVVIDLILIYISLQPADSPWTTTAVTLLQIAVFVAKLMAFNIFFIVVRWTLPRFRHDQVQTLGWRYLLPLALLNIFVTAIVVVGVSS